MLSAKHDVGPEAVASVRPDVIAPPNAPGAATCSARPPFSAMKPVMVADPVRRFNVVAGDKLDDRPPDAA